MKVKVNDKEYEVPFDLSEVTLDDYCLFYEQYGKGLEEELKKFNEKEFDNDEDRMFDFDNHLDNEAIAWFSFWTKLDFKESKDVPGVQELLNYYKYLRKVMHDCEKEAEQTVYEDINWNGEVWRIQDWKVNPTSKMSFNEIITSKEIMRQTKKFSVGKWSALKYLCCVFLRKKDEKFEDEMVWEGSPRMKLIGTIPLSYALRVGFFLRSCVSFLVQTLAYSQKTEIQNQSL